MSENGASSSTKSSPPSNTSRFEHKSKPTHRRRQRLKIYPPPSYPMAMFRRHNPINRRRAIFPVLKRRNRSSYRLLFGSSIPRQITLSRRWHGQSRIAGNLYVEKGSNKGKIS